jgi:hypothetical protein
MNGVQKGLSAEWRVVPMKGEKNPLELQLPVKIRMDMENGYLPLLKNTVTTNPAATAISTMFHTWRFSSTFAKGLE